MNNKKRFVVGYWCVSPFWKTCQLDCADCSMLRIKKNKKDILKKIRYKLYDLKHNIKYYSERRHCHICEIKLKRKDRVKFYNDGLICSLCNNCNISDWSI